MDAYSPDGLLYERETGRRGIFENKTTNILQSMQREKWNDQVPDNYYIQVLHGLMVPKFDFIVLKTQLKTEWKDKNIRLDTRHYLINREDVLGDLQWLENKEVEQYNMYYITGKEPPTLLPII